jgi:glycosidase
MKLFNLFAGLLFSVSMIQAQVIVTDPPFPTADEAVTITFDASQGGGGLAGFTGDVYTHTGLIVQGNTNWQNVIGNWGNNNTQPKLTRIGADLYTLEISPSIREFYNASESVVIEKLAFVFRAASGSPQTEDLFYDIYEVGLNVSILLPLNGSIIELNQNVQVEASASEADSLLLYLNGGLIAATAGNQLSHTLMANTPGSQWLRVDAKTDTEMVSDSVYFFTRGDSPVAALPEDVIPGINYIDNQSVILVLHDPPALKEFVFVLGDFNDWMVHEDFYMNRTPDGTHYWISIDELEPGREYIYQYYIDGELRLADPFTHKVSDPWQDHWISNATYPNLIQYPENKTTGIASVLQTAQQPYQWEVEDFDPPAVEKLVIYELHIRDFVATRDIKTVTDTLDYLERLGVNAIELMPFNEFEGNNSWGYNPSFYFATDKAYGRANDYKKFIDEAHKRGMAVIMDVVLNHAYTQSPMVQMYFDPNAGQWGQTTADNPWFNQTCPHEPWCWGHDFNHESIYTQQFIDRFNAYWLTEFKVDGFRFDFTKGFTNTQTGNQGSSYDASRVAHLKRMANHIWNVNEDAYVILEHFADNPEEKVLAEYGMLIWGNMNYAYNEATMGWTANSNFTWISHKARGWSVPHLIGYMESHDEERLMFKNKEYGNSSNPAHDAKQLHIATKRNAAAAAFFFAVPGPKMIWQFGELGYDYSINHCEDGTINDGCRTNPKPVKWDYYNNWQRRDLYNYYSELIHLKKEHEVFNTNDFTMSVAGAQKRINLNHPEMSVVLVGNFSVEQGSMNPAFPFTGMWYDHFNNDSINVTDVNAAIDLEPGEFILFTSKKLDSPTFVGLNETGINTEFPVLIYPNPSNSSFTLDLNLTHGKAFDIRLMNAQGQLLEVVHQGKLQSGQHQFTLGENNSLQGGLYFIQLSDGIRTETKKLIRL